MNQADDKTFIRRFSGIIVGLVVFTFLIIMLAVNFQNEPDPAADNPSQARLAEERIAPVASVRTGDDAAQPEVSAESEPVVAASSAPFDGSLDGKLIYDNVCAACHDSGVANAPRWHHERASRQGPGNAGDERHQRAQRHAAPGR